MQDPISSAGRFYRPELDVVRLLAFLLVYCYHVLPFGDDPRIASLLGRSIPLFNAVVNVLSFGMSLFFTLSAFLICELLLRERQSAGAVGVKQFYIRRILRIWPLYYLGLALGAAAALLPGSQPGDLTRVGWFSIFMGAWYLATHGDFYQPILPLWSIAVEEQFYLFAPWAVKFFNRKLLYGFCALVLLVSNGWLYHLGRISASDNGVWCNSFVQFECFAAGILLCLVLNGRLPKLALWQRLILLVCAGGCWFLSTYFLHARFDDNQNPGSWPLIGGYALAALAAVMILVAFLGIAPKLLPGWAIYLGRISFGLYVYHGFAIYVIGSLMIGDHATAATPWPLSRLFLNAGLSVSMPFVLTVGMAALSYRYFETPFLKLKKRHAVIESQPIASAGAFKTEESG
jgi:peptidoglycan/LPS O-acetylase OafA/YrhL